MSTTNNRAAVRTREANQRDQKTDLYDPHFPIKRREAILDRTAIFDPHFPPVRRGADMPGLTSSAS